MTREPIIQLERRGCTTKLRGCFAGDGGAMSEANDVEVKSGEALEGAFRLLGIDIEDADDWPAVDGARGVARKQNPPLRQVESDAPGRMTRNVDHARTAVQVDVIVVG